MSDLAPGFLVLEVAPGPVSGLWNYVSVGAGPLSADSTEHLEFVLAMESPSDRGVELVTMAAWYHGKETLGVGHTLPIGEPWIGDSPCDHFLVCLPYPFGPDLESVPGVEGRARVLWLLPITKAERDYRATHGAEALEKLFDASRIRFWEMHRESVVPVIA